MADPTPDSGSPPQASESASQPKPASESAPTPPADDAKQRVALIMIVPDRAVLDDIVTALLDLGLGGTIIESKGLMATVREEMPVFSGLAELMPEHTGSKVVLSATTKARAQDVFDYLQAEVPEAERPIAFTLPISQLLGAPR